MAEYIDREAIMKFPIRKDHCDKEHANGHFINGIESVLEYVENLPAVDVAPVRYGRWISVPHKLARVCSVCNRDEPYKFADIEADVYDYCPNCGAKMDGGYRAV